MLGDYPFNAFLVQFRYPVFHSFTLGAEPLRRDKSVFLQTIHVSVNLRRAHTSVQDQRGLVHQPGHVCLA